MGKRLVIVAALTCAALLAGFAARADDYPNRPIRVVVGFSAGSGADITARVVGQRMGQILGQQIVVENKTGAGSSLAAEFVARAPKDGYTLLLATIANPINAAMSSNLSFDFPKDFVPIVRLTTTPTILVVHPSVGVKSDRPTKKSPFMPTNTTRKMPTTGQVSAMCRRRTAKRSFVPVGAASGRTSR